MKNVKHLLLKSLLLIALVHTAGLAQLPRLKVDGKYIKDPYGNRVILRGVSLPDLAFLNYGKDNGWGNPSAIELAGRMTDQSKGWYTNVIRLPIHPDGFSFVPYRWTALSHDAFYTNHLRPFVDYCKQRRVYVIIDWHYVHDSYGTDSDGGDVDAKTRDFWNYIAPRFKDDDNVLFEVFNEPIDTDQPSPRWNGFKNRVQPWVNIIRGHAPTTPILVGGPVWDQEIGSSASNPVAGGNIIYVSHIYPFSGVDWAKEQAIAAAANAPVVIGEWGWDQDENSAPLSQRPTYPSEMKTMVQNYAMSWINWSATPNWYPGLLQSDWLNIKTGTGYAGDFLKQWLWDERNNNQPCTANCGGTSIKIYAAGRTNTEQMELRINGTTVRTWTNVGGNANAASFVEHTYAHPSAVAASSVAVHFTNDGGDRDLRVDRVVVGTATYQSEGANSTGTWTGTTCGNAGSEWLHCNGRFAYTGSASRTASQTSLSPERVRKVVVYPNPYRAAASGGSALRVTLGGYQPAGNLQLTLLNPAGQVVLRQTVRAAGEAEFGTTLNVKSRLRRGMYVLVVYGNGKVDYRKVLVE